MGRERRLGRVTAGNVSTLFRGHMHEHIIIQDREELFYLLSEAAEFEHSVMCSYLYTMWTLKSDVAEGVTATELAAIEGWRRSIRQVALEEMLHLALVNNILAAIGASPHLWRPEYPVRPGRFPDGVVLRLSRFTEATIDHFIYIERPEGIRMVDGAGFDHPAHYSRATRPDLLSPTPQDYASQGQLYHSVLRGLGKLVDELGEKNVFVGHGEAQVGAAEFGLPGLFKVDSLEAARRAVEVIVHQGEGAPTHREGSHYQRFVAIKEELVRLKRERPDFEPARPVVENPTLIDPGGRQDVTPIGDALTSKIVDLGDSLYSLMMRSFAQVFAPAPLPRDLRAGLALAATELMYAMNQVGELVTRLPIGPAPQNATAGLTFALLLSSGQLVQRCAAQILNERVRELAGAAAGLEVIVPLHGLAKRLGTVGGRFADLHTQFEERLGAAVDTVAQVRPPPSSARVSAPAAATNDPNIAHTKGITLRFNGQRCIHSRHCVLGAPSVFLANVTGPWLHPERVTVEECVAIAHACPSGAITYERHDGGRLGIAEHAHGRRGVRRREVHQSGVDADHHARMREQGRSLGNRHRWRKLGRRGSRRDAPRARLLGVVAPGQDAADPLCAERLRDAVPGSLGPQLGRARGRVQQHGVRARRREPGARRCRQAVVDGCGGGVAERLCGDGAVAGDLVVLGVELVARIVAPDGEALADGVKAESVQRAGLSTLARGAARDARDDQALDQTLGVENQLVVAARELAPRCAHLAPGGGEEDLRAPAAQGKRNDAVDCGMQRGERDVGLLDRPVNLPLRPLAPNVGDGRKGVHDVPEGRQAHEQDGWHCCFVFARPARSPRP